MHLRRSTTVAVLLLWQDCGRLDRVRGARPLRPLALPDPYHECRFILLLYCFFPHRELGRNIESEISEQLGSKSDRNSPAKRRRAENPRPYLEERLGDMTGRGRTGPCD